MGTTAPTPATLAAFQQFYRGIPAPVARIERPGKASVLTVLVQRETRLSLRVYSVAFTRTSVRVSSYEDDAVLAAIETWADGVPALG